MSASGIANTVPKKERKSVSRVSVTLCIFGEEGAVTGHMLPKKSGVSRNNSVLFPNYKMSVKAIHTFAIFAKLFLADFPSFNLL